MLGEQLGEVDPFAASQVKKLGSTRETVGDHRPGLVGPPDCGQQVVLRDGGADVVVTAFGAEVACQAATALHHPRRDTCTAEDLEIRFEAQDSTVMAVRLNHGADSRPIRRLPAISPSEQLGQGPYGARDRDAGITAT